MERADRGGDELSRYLKWRMQQDLTTPMPFFPTLSRKMGRRQFLARAAALGAALSGMAVFGCGKEKQATPAPGGAESPARGASLSVFNAAHTAAWRLFARDFEQLYGASLRFTTEQFGLMPTVLTPAFEGGTATWDVVYIWRAWVEQYRRYLVPLDELGVRIDTSDMVDKAVEAIKSLDGKYYGFPSTVYTYVLYGNRKLLSRLGVNQLPRRYDDFVALARELTGPGQFGYTDGWAPLYLLPKWVVWLHLNGGKLYSQGERGDVLFDAPEAMQATQDMKDLLRYMPAESPTSPWGIYDVEAKKLFFNETAAMIIDYQHIWYEAQNPSISKVGKGNVLVGLVPGSKRGPGGRQGPESAGQWVGECFAIPRTSAKKEAALELVKFFGSPQTQLGLLTRRAEILSFDPADEVGFPCYRSAYTNPTVPADDRPIIEVTLEQQKYPGDRYGTRPAYQAIADTIEAAVSSVLLGQKDVERAHREAQQALRNIVAQERV